MFTTKPRLGDRQFTQLSDDVLNLSGTTDFIGTLKLKGIEVDIDPNNINVGDVFSYDGNKIILQPNVFSDLDGITVKGSATQSGNDILFNNEWRWRIDGTLYGPTNPTNLNFPVSSSGFQRIDLVIGDNLGNIQRVNGNEVLIGEPVIAPNQPSNTVLLMEVTVFDTGVQSFIEFALASFVRFDEDDQNLTSIQRQNARTNIQALSKDTDDTKTGNLRMITQGGGEMFFGKWVNSNNNLLTFFDNQGKRFFQLRESVPGTGLGNENATLTLKAHNSGGNTRTVISILDDSDELLWSMQKDGVNRFKIPPFHPRSSTYNQSVRRDELYLNYSQLIATSGNIHDLTLNDDAQLIIFTNASELTGIVSGSGNNGRLLRIEARGINLLIRNDSNNSNTNNRFNIGNDITIESGNVLSFIYTNNRWRALSTLDGYSSTDFDSDFNNKTTDDLDEGDINKYLTGNEFQKNVDTLDDINEGTNNLHFTTSLFNKLDDIEEDANNYSHPNHSGDVSSIGDGETIINSAVVTNTKLANVGSNTLKGRIASGSGTPSDLSVSDVRTMLEVETTSQLNNRDTANRDRTNHTGTQAISTISGLQTELNNKLESGDISDFETTTQLNNRDTANRNRTNHTGTQAISTITGLQTELNEKELLSNKVTSLASANNTTYPTTAAVVAAIEDVAVGESFQGQWNADTNTPTLVSSVGEDGHYYVVSVSGTTTLDGESNWEVGDEVIFRNDVWIKRQSFAVITWAGKTGAVIPEISDIIGLQTELNNKLESGDISDFETTTQLNNRDTANRDRTNHTGSQAISTITGLQTELNNKLESSDISNFETTTQLNSRDTANRDRTNHTGTQAISTISGLQTELNNKLESGDISDFETTTQLNNRDTANRNRTNHTGTQAISTITGLQTELNNKLESSDISDFETTTQLNSRDTANRDRSNHTGTQLSSTISDFQTAVSSNSDVTANTNKRSYPIGDEEKLETIQTGAQVNPTSEEIRDQIEGLEGEDKLDINELKGGSILDDNFFEGDGTELDKFRPIIDSEPTENSNLPVSSGSVFNALQNINVPSIITDYIPAFNISNLEEKSIPEFTYRDSLRCNNYSLILYSGGTSSNRILRTDDGITFREINTASANFWRLRKNTLGTIIAVSTTTSDSPIHRGTDGLNFSTITLPEISSVQAETQMSGVASIGTNWITCGRTGDYRIFRSVDDGETWIESNSYPNDQTYVAATSINDIFLVLAQTGSDRVKRSTDLGENFDNITVPGRFWMDMITFKGKILLLRGGPGSTPLMMVSEDLGLTFTDLFTNTHPVFDSSFNMVKFSVVGEYLFIAGNNGVLLRTKDLQEYDLISLPNSNAVATVVSNSYNGSREMLNIFSSSGINRLIVN